MTRPLFGLIAVLGAACGGRPSDLTPAALVPCALPGVGSADAAWRQVRASGFTFCIPASWPARGQIRDSIDPQRWEGDDGVLTWGLGLPTVGMTTSYTVTGVIVRGTAMMGGVAPLPNPKGPQRCSRSNTPVMVEDSALVITQVLCQGAWTITAWSTAPAVYVQGVARDFREAERLLLVMQTIRFSPLRR